MTSPRRVEFYFDYASPWAYLANRILDTYLPLDAVVYRPLYLRGLDTFKQGMPYGPLKLRYLLTDMSRCAAKWDVPFRVPDEFPINGLYAVRAATWALEHGGFSALNDRLFAATWSENRPISTREAVLSIAAESGLDAERLSAGLDDPGLKDAVRRTTEEAQDRGVFGVPTFFVGDEMFWGHDRLAHVREHFQNPAGS